MLPPSNLPSGTALKNLAVRTLCGRDPLRRRWREIARNNRYKRVTPEILFQRFYACLGESSFLRFFDVLKHAHANAAHRALRLLTAKRLSRTLTTNFDMLIESGYDDQSRTVHLHGALDRPNTMVVRINQVGRGLEGKFQKVVRRQLSGMTLCVLGYSGADNDIFMTVRTSRVTRILWLIRKRDDQAWRNLQRFGRKHQVQVAIADLRVLFRKLAKARFRSKARASVDEAERRRSIKGWLQGTRLVDRYACLSEVFFEIEDYRRAADISQEAFKVAQGTELAGWFRIQAAEAHKILGNFGRATRFARQAIQLNRRIGDPFDVAGSYNIFGLIQTEKAKPDLTRAKRALKKAISVIQTIDLTKCTRQRCERIRNFHARALNNLGLAFSYANQIDRAVSTYQRSLAIKRDLGDLLGIAITSANISLAYLRGRKLRLASKWRERALELMDRYELGFQKAYLLRQTGVITCEHGDLMNGHDYLRRALKVYAELRQTPFGQKLTEQALKKYRLQKGVLTDPA
jgi:tetratricopeptide (TPR) repeat protein